MADKSDFEDLIYGKLVLHQTSQYPGLPTEFKLLEAEHSVGRNDATANGQPQFMIAAAYISGTHCRVFIANPDQSQTPLSPHRGGSGEAEVQGPELVVFLQDLSSNGTFVNDTLVGKGKTVQLQHLDIVQLYKPKSNQLRGQKTKGNATHTIVYQFHVVSSGLTQVANDKRRRLKKPKTGSPNSSPSARARRGLSPSSAGKRKASPQIMKPPPPKRVAPVEKPADSSEPPPSAAAALPAPLEKSDIFRQLEKQLKEAQEKKSSLEKRVKSLDNELAKFNDVKEELSKSKGEADQLRAALSKLKNEAQAASQEGGDKSKVITALRADKEDLDQRLTETNQRYSEMRKEKAALQAELRSEKANSKSLQDRVENAQKNECLEREKTKELELQVRKMQQKINELEGLLATQKEEIERAGAVEIELEELKAQSDIFKSDLDSKRAECMRINALHTDLSAELQKERSEAAQLREENTNAQEEIKKLTNLSEQQKDEINSLKKAKVQNEEDLNEHKRHLAEQGAKLEAKAAELRSRIIDLKSSRAKTHELHSNLCVLKGKIREIESNLELAWQREEETKKELRNHFKIDISEIELDEIGRDEELQVPDSAERVVSTPASSHPDWAGFSTGPKENQEDPKYFLTQEMDKADVDDEDNGGMLFPQRCLQLQDAEGFTQDQDLNYMESEDTERAFQGRKKARQTLLENDKFSEEENGDEHASEHSTESDDDLMRPIKIPGHQFVSPLKEGNLSSFRNKNKDDEFALSGHENSSLFRNRKNEPKIKNDDVIHASVDSPSKQAFENEDQQPAYASAESKIFTHSVKEDCSDVLKSIILTRQRNDEMDENVEPFQKQEEGNKSLLSRKNTKDIFARSRGNGGFNVPNCFFADSETVDSP